MMSHEEMPLPSVGPVCGTVPTLSLPLLGTVIEGATVRCMRIDASTVNVSTKGTSRKRRLQSPIEDLKLIVSGPS